MKPRLTLAVLLVGAATVLSGCNGEGGGTAQKAGSGAGPTQGAGSSNTPGTATNGGPATP